MEDGRRGERDAVKAAGEKWTLAVKELRPQSATLEMAIRTEIVCQPGLDPF